jgi:hypothetical protein
MAGRASVELLELLHNTLAEQLLERVKDPEAKPADLSNAIKFLKDNGIEQLPTNENQIGDLLKNLPFDKLMESATEQH